MFDELVAGIRSLFSETTGTIPLHAPWFDSADEEAVAACVRSTFVSSVGADITAFEQELCEFTGSPHVVAVVNGTAALHVALLLNDVGPGDLVITQAFTFIATCNAIAYTGAEPVFLDIDADTLGLSPIAVQRWLESECDVKGGIAMHRGTGKRVRACIPMHTFGHVMHINALRSICSERGIALIEDAAEALGSQRDGKHAGTFAPVGTLSFNGNKIITCGGGGALLIREEEHARAARHLTTQAKLPHPWAFDHDRIGYNYRMPALNAALGRSQLRKLPHNLAVKRALHSSYLALFARTPWQLFTAPSDTAPNHWLNAVLFHDRSERDAFLKAATECGIQVRPAWGIGADQPMYAHAVSDGLRVSRDVQHRLVNLPSSANPPGHERH
jgi:aminotransferase in exopolysaccharide biosynthesis